MTGVEIRVQILCKPKQTARDLMKSLFFVLKIRVDESFAQDYVYSGKKVNGCCVNRLGYRVLKWVINTMKHS